MARPSRHHDQRLIETAKRLFPKVGASGMTLKMIADKAGVNPGMFNYYFKTKSNFIRRVLESLVEEARRGVEIHAPEGSGAGEKLRHYLNVMGRTFRDQRKLALAMYRDVLNQDPDVAGFMVANSERQMEFLQPLIEECQREGFADSRLSVYQIASFCMAAVKTPITISGALEGMSRKKASLLPEARARLMTDEAISERVEMALRGIAPLGATGP